MQKLLKKKQKKIKIEDQKWSFYVLLGCTFETTLPSLKQAFSNLLKCKVLWENKNRWIGNQICLNWVFLELILR